MSDPFLLVGLGNPGAKYALTRHNIGFMVVDVLAARWGVDSFSSKFHGQLGETNRAGRKVLMLKPQTYMNRSGLSAAEVVTFYKIPTDTSALVIVDEIDLAPGTIRIRKDGGSGGHNGMKSLIESLGGEKFPRLRLGVGRSPVMDAADHVLQKIQKADWPLYEELVARGADAVESILENGLDKAMNIFNTKDSKEPKT